LTRKAPGGLRHSSRRPQDDAGLLPDLADQRLGDEFTRLDAAAGRRPEDHVVALLFDEDDRVASAQNGGGHLENGWIFGALTTIKGTYPS